MIAIWNAHNDKKEKKNTYAGGGALPPARFFFEYLAGEGAMGSERACLEEVDVAYLDLVSVAKIQSVYVEEAPT